MGILLETPNASTIAFARLDSTQVFKKRPLCGGWQKGRSTLALRGWPGYSGLVHLGAPREP